MAAAVPRRGTSSTVQLVSGLLACAGKGLVSPVVINTLQGVVLIWTWDEAPSAAAAAGAAKPVGGSISSRRSSGSVRGNSRGGESSRARRWHCWLCSESQITHRSTAAAAAAAGTGLGSSGVGLQQGRDVCGMGASAAMLLPLSRPSPPRASDFRKQHCSGMFGLSQQQCWPIRLLQLGWLDIVFVLVCWLSRSQTVVLLCYYRGSGVLVRPSAMERFSCTLCCHGNWLARRCFVHVCSTAGSAVCVCFWVVGCMSTREVSWMQAGGSGCLYIFIVRNSVGCSSSCCLLGPC